jgi:hypothetical protein
MSDTDTERERHCQSMARRQFLDDQNAHGRDEIMPLFGLLSRIMDGPILLAAEFCPL